MATARFVVSGRVQGVFYRASTREQATGLGIQGHAMNLADGSVEVLASGSDEALAALQQWLAQGPPAASVTSVTRENCDKVPLQGFRCI